MEILLSLMVLSSAIVVLFQGMKATDALVYQSNYEADAACFAEREIELLKRDLIIGRHSQSSFKSRGRFRLPKGWKSFLAWTKPDNEKVVRVSCQVSHGDTKVNIESFVYCPTPTHENAL